MRKVLIETKDIEIKFSLLTSEEIVKLIRKFEKRKRLEMSLEKIR